MKWKGFIQATEGLGVGWIEKEMTFYKYNKSFSIVLEVAVLEWRKRDVKKIHHV